MVWFNKEDVIAVLARGVVVQAAVIAVFGERASDFEVVHSAESYTFALRNLRNGEIVGEQNYDPDVEFTTSEVLKRVAVLARGLGVTA